MESGVGDHSPNHPRHVREAKGRRYAHPDAQASHDRPDRARRRSLHRGVFSASALARGPAGAGPRRRGDGARNRSRRLDAPDPGDVPGHRCSPPQAASRSGQLAALPCPWSAPSWAGWWPSRWREAWPVRRSRRRCCDARGVGGSMACSSAKALWQRSPRGSCRGSPPRACTTPPASHPSGRERSRERSRSVRCCGRLHMPCSVRASAPGRSPRSRSQRSPSCLEASPRHCSCVSFACRHPCERADLQDQMGSSDSSRMRSEVMRQLNP